MEQKGKQMEMEQKGKQMEMEVESAWEARCKIRDAFAEQERILRDRNERVKSLVTENISLKNHLTEVTHKLEQVAKKIIDDENERESTRRALIMYETDFQKENKEKTKALRELHQMKKRLHDAENEIRESNKRYTELMQRVSASSSSRTTPNETYRTVAPRRDIRR